MMQYLGPLEGDINTESTWGFKNTSCPVQHDQVGRATS